jgi:hypothetical protein
MTEQKKLSRRDAIKLLGAVTGATVLANLPSKWKTPEMVSGVLPVHAQTSNPNNPILHTLNCGNNLQIFPFMGTINTSTSVTINPADSGIPMVFSIAFLFGASFVNFGSPQGGVVATVNGVASHVTTPINVPVLGSGIQVTWSFQNPADGTGTCTQTITSTNIPPP